MTALHRAAALERLPSRRGESVIVSIVVLGHRSTVELSANGHVRQHKGPKNARPHELCAAALDVCRRRWGLAPMPSPPSP